MNELTGKWRYIQNEKKKKQAVPHQRIHLFFMNDCYESR